MQVKLEGCSPHHFHFQLTYSKEQRQRMSDNEKSLFPDRVPVVIQRSYVEKDLQKLRMQYMSTPKDQPLSGIVEYIADKLQLPRLSNVTILVGE